MRQLLRRADGGAPFRRTVFSPRQEERQEDTLFPDVDRTALLEGIFALSWCQHGGSGLGWTRTEIMNLDIHEFRWLLDRVASQRAREARELRRAFRRR